MASSTLLAMSKDAVAGILGDVRSVLGDGLAHNVGGVLLHSVGGVLGDVRGLSGRSLSATINVATAVSSGVASIKVVVNHIRQVKGVLHHHLRSSHTSGQAFVWVFQNC